MDQAEEEEPTRAGLQPIDELSRQLHGPFELPRFEASSLSLSHIPWTLKVGKTCESRESEAVSHFPTYSYLDLRRQQNTAWATARLVEGNKIIFEDARKAENLFKQGLDLVPDHVDLLVAYGQLLAKTNRQNHAITHFQRALQVDPECSLAKEQLEKIHTQQSLQRQAPRKPSAPVPRESSVFQDVLLERSLLQDSSALLPVETDEQNVESSTREEKKHSKKHSKKYRKKRRRSRSPSSSSESSNDSYRRHKRKKRSRSSPSSSSYSSDESSREDRRRRRKHRKHRSKRKYKKKKKRHRDDD